MVRFNLKKLTEVGGKAGDTRALNIRARNARPFQWTLGICSDERCFTCVCLFQYAGHTGCLAILPCIANY
jgi:hypothetical protein